MLGIERNDDGIRLHGLWYDRLLDAAARPARAEQSPPKRSFVLRRRERRRLLNGVRIDNKGRKGLHGRGPYRACTADQPFPLLPLLLDDPLPFLVLPPPLLMGPVYIPLLPILEDLESPSLGNWGRMRKVRKRISIRREIQQLRRRGRRLHPPNLWKWSKRFERRRKEGRSRRLRCLVSKRSRHADHGIDRL